MNRDFTGIARSVACVGTVLAMNAWVASWLPSLESSTVIAQARQRPAGWTDATHGAQAKPDYERLFSMDRVHELRITVPPERFKAMQEDLATLTPGFGRGGGGRGLAAPFGAPGGRGGVPDFAALMEAASSVCTGKAAGDSCTVPGLEAMGESQCNAAFGGALMCTPKAFAEFGRGGIAPHLTSRDPIYVPVTVEHDGRRWTHVGMRYKGNSSLMSDGDPAQNGRLRWIPWDNNMAFGVGLGNFGGGRGRFGGRGPLPSQGPRAGGPPAGFGVVGGDVLHRQVGDRWPLIHRLLADEVYSARYRELLQHALEGLASAAAFEKRARDLHALIASSLVGPQGERTTHTTLSSPEGFEQSLDGPNGLLAQMNRRREAARVALEAGAQ